VKLAALTAVIALSGCGQMVQHPVPTFAGVGLVFGFGTCEMADVGAAKCGVVGASTGLLLGGITALVYLLTDTSPQQMVGDEIPADQRVGPRHHAPIVLPPEPEPEPASGSGSASASASASASDTGSGSGSGSGSAAM
jgi:hypothetical protein